jgi:hypothetical protein
MALQKVTTRRNADTPAVSQVLDDADHSQEGVIASLRRQYRAEELAEFSVEPYEPEKPKRAAKPSA